MKVCFVDPRGIHFGLNTGLGYLASYLGEVCGLEGIKVFDFNNNLEDVETRIDEIRACDVVGFSIKSFTKDSAVEIASKVKTPENVVIAGGPHISLDAENFLAEHRSFDFAVRGEGESSVAALIKALETADAIETVKGLAYRDDGRVVSSRPAERTRELDRLPYPDYSAFDSVADKVIYNYPLVTSRGCPFMCTYCCVQGVMGRKWFARSVENIMGELRHARQSYDISCFNIQDDNFTLDMTRAREFCDALVSEGLTMPWSCPNGIRADKVDDRLFQRMRRSGCFAVAMGIESGVPEEFETIDKGETLEDIVNAVESAKRNKIWVFGNFIIGLPGSTLASIRKSVQFAKRLKLESCIFNLIVPFPGTRLWQWALENGRFIMDWKDGFTQGKLPKIVFETDEFPSHDRLRAYREANIKCYNYFAFMDEHDSLLSNILSVLKAIVVYDFFGIPGHFFWCLKHFKRILKRVAEKNV